MVLQRWNVVEKWLYHFLRSGLSPRRTKTRKNMNNFFKNKFLDYLLIMEGQNIAPQHLWARGHDDWVNYV